MTLILGTASEARAKMLRDAGVAIETHPASVDEDAVKQAYRADGSSARTLAEALAEIKAKHVGASHPKALTLGADQILDFEGTTLDKPHNRDEARAQLQSLRGKSHELISAAVICEGATPVWRRTGTAKLTMRFFTDAFLDEYLDEEGDAVLTTVGGYRIEQRGAQLFNRIEGDYFSILGLPLLEVLGFLRERGMLTE